MLIIFSVDESMRIKHNIQEFKFIPKYIINTRNHIDHICAIDAFSAFYHVPLAIHASTHVNANGQMADAYYW